ncbi:YybH family protein [Aquimarina sediminis]|uniref:YybH family protein n=1 Tax=Aquimarina sediminis TaxID=2070536 RepID=UPI002936DA38|nr:nuclear transport factor 2 family protein [Aquimarina sediminis]
MIMKYLFILWLVIGLTSCNQKVNSDEKSDKQQIISILKAQEQSWSNHDLEGFMEGYWKSDSLKFYGSKGLTYGWNNTLTNYKKRYPTKAHTGKLSFVINDISRIDNESYFVMGEYHLKRSAGNANGVFMIIFKKINGNWKIIADTSC